MSNHKVFLDMDGVIADFTRGALEYVGLSIPPFKTLRWDFINQLGLPVETFWRTLSHKDFWANLPVLEDGRELYNIIADVVGPGNIVVLSSGIVEGSCDGKRLWLRRHFPLLEKTAVFGSVKDQLAAPCKILVDDHQANIDAFRAAGGRAIIVPRPWNELAYLTDDDGGFNAPHVASLVLAYWSDLKCSGS